MSGDLKTLMDLWQDSSRQWETIRLMREWSKKLEDRCAELEERIELLEESS